MRKEAEKCERFFIAEFKTMVPNGYNKEPGGKPGGAHYVKKKL